MDKFGRLDFVICGKSRLLILPFDLISTLRPFMSEHTRHVVVMLTTIPLISF
jgi:hypothetical protein